MHRWTKRSSKQEGRKKCEKDRFENLRGCKCRLHISQLRTPKVDKSNSSHVIYPSGTADWLTYTSRTYVCFSVKPNAGRPRIAAYRNVLCSSERQIRPSHPQLLCSVYCTPYTLFTSSAYLFIRIVWPMNLSLLLSGFIPGRSCLSFKCQSPF